MNVTDQVRKEVDELIDRLSRDEVRDLLDTLRERFARENEELQSIYQVEK
jgi:hypothetical protein